MRVTAVQEISRGLLVTLLASTGGCLLGVLPFGGNPLGALSVAPITLFGSVVVLLPIYIWLRAAGRSPRFCYVAVVVSGFLGGWFLLNAITGFIALRIGSLGASFGFATAICWVLAHRLTKGLGIANAGDRLQQ